MKIINNFNEYLNLKSEYGLSKNANSDEMIKLIVWAFKKPNNFTNTKVCRCGNKFLYSWIKFNPNAWIQFKKGCRFLTWSDGLTSSKLLEFWSQYYIWMPKTLCENPPLSLTSYAQLHFMIIMVRWIQKGGEWCF